MGLWSICDRPINTEERENLSNKIHLEMGKKIVQFEIAQSGFYALLFRMQPDVMFGVVTKSIPKV